MSKPKVSVVIPTYNRALTLRDRSLKSIQKQTYTDWECVIVDDGSSDNTEEIIRAVARREPRIRYFKKENGGQSSARNFGIRNSRGAYIALLDHDDEFLPTYLEKGVRALDAAPPDVTYLVPGVIARDYSGRDTYAYPEYEPYWKHSRGGSCLYKRKIFFEDGLFFDEDQQNFEDNDLNIRFHFSGQKGLKLMEPLVVCYSDINHKSASTNHHLQRRCFEKFFKKNINIYENAGREALAWLYRYGGILYLRDGRMREGRLWLWKALRLRPTLVPVIYIAVSFFGPLVFLKFFIFKSNLMRFLRFHLLNRWPHNMPS